MLTLLNSDSLIDIILTQPVPKCYEILSKYNQYDLSEEEKIIEFQNSLSTLIFKTNTYCRNMTTSKKVVVEQMKKQWKIFLEILDKKGDTKRVEIANHVAEKCKILKEQNYINPIDCLKIASLADCYKILSKFDQYEISPEETEDFKETLTIIFTKTENFISTMDTSKEVDLLKMRNDYKKFLKVLHDNNDFKTKQMAAGLTKMWETVDCLLEPRKKDHTIFEQSSSISMFKFNDCVRNLKTEAATPAILCKLFNIHDLMLVDDEDNVYIVSNDKFEPYLVRGKTYNVLGTKSNTVDSINTCVQNISNPTMSVIQNIENILLQTLTNKTIVNESAECLFYLARLPYVLDFIAAFSSTIPNFSLIGEIAPRQYFKFLSHPESFRGCISQIASEAREAYRTMDNSMNTLRSVLLDLPDDFSSVIEIIYQPSLNTVSLKTMEILQSKILKATEHCQIQTKHVQLMFENVMKTIEELCHALIVSDAKQTLKNNEIENRKQILNLQALERKAQELKYEAAEAENRLNRTKNDYQEASLRNEVLMNPLIPQIDLTSIKESWRPLVAFADNFKIVVEHNFVDYTSLFSEHIKENSSQSLITRSAIKAVACGIQLSYYAEIYVTISRKYVMPIITGVSRELFLTKEEAQQKQIDIQTNLSNVEKSVRQFIDEKKLEFDDCVNQKMKRFTNNLKNAINLKTSLNSVF